MGCDDEPRRQGRTPAELGTYIAVTVRRTRVQSASDFSGKSISVNGQLPDEARLNLIVTVWQVSHSPPLLPCLVPLSQGSPVQGKWT